MCILSQYFYKLEKKNTKLCLFMSQGSRCIHVIFGNPRKVDSGNFTNSINRVEKKHQPGKLASAKVLINCEI